MPASVEILAQQVLQLPPAERTRLLDRVIDSLDADRERDARWNALAAQRDAEAEADSSLLVPGPQALARIGALNSISLRRPGSIGARAGQSWPTASSKRSSVLPGCSSSFRKSARLRMTCAAFIRSRTEITPEACSLGSLRATCKTSRFARWKKACRTRR